VADSASMRCARVVRGTPSIASTVAFFACSFSRSSRFCDGQMKEISAAPSFMRAISSKSGARTFKITSASRHSVAASTMRAPASMYAAST
jgi:hypothetical protein